MVLHPDTDPDADPSAGGLAALPPLLLDPRAPEPSHLLRSFLQTFKGRVLFAAESAGRREMLNDLLRQEGIPSSEGVDWATF